MLSHHLGDLDPRVLLYCPAFAVGLLLSGPLLGGAAERHPWRSRGTALLGALSVVALALSLAIPDKAMETSLQALPMATLVPAWLVVLSSSRLRGCSLPGWLQTTSTASFFLYLLHRPLLEGLKAAAVGLGLTQPWWLLLALLVLGIPPIVGLSWWAQWLYNRSLKALGL